MSGENRNAKPIMGKFIFMSMKTHFHMEGTPFGLALKKEAKSNNTIRGQSDIFSYWVKKRDI